MEASVEKVVVTVEPWIVAVTVVVAVVVTVVVVAVAVVVAAVAGWSTRGAEIEAESGGVETVVTLLDAYAVRDR